MGLIIFLVVLIAVAYLLGGPKKKNYPVICETMFDPPDQPITLAKAKQLYRKVMLETGHLDREEISYHVEHFTEEIKDELAMLKETAADTQGEIAESKKQITALKQKLKTTKDEYDRDDIRAEIESTEDDTQSYLFQLKEEQAEYNALKEDKKKFLINALNTELHGQPS